MRYRLRTLMILMAIGPPLLAVAWFYASPLPPPTYTVDQIVVSPESGILGDNGEPAPATLIEP